MLTDRCRLSEGKRVCCVYKFSGNFPVVFKCPFMRFFAIVLLFCFPFRLFADVYLPRIFQNNMVLQQNAKVAVWGWAQPWEVISITTGWDGITRTVMPGVTADWQLELQTPAAGGPYSIVIRSDQTSISLENILIGEVWILAGQSNMEWHAKAGALDAQAALPTCRNDQLRFFRMPRQTADAPQNDFKGGQWRICDSASLYEFSAVGYFFGKKLHENLDNTPIGLIDLSWGGSFIESWIPEELVRLYPESRRSAAGLETIPWAPAQSAIIYNAMVAPLTAFNIAGVVWYQGESNRIYPEAYYTLMHQLLESWRGVWRRHFPFYFVQIAPFYYEDKAKLSAAAVREAQYRAQDLPQTGMVVTTDQVDDLYNIHPSYKQGVGERLARWALGEYYRRPAGPYRHPSFQNMQVDGARVILSFADLPNGFRAVEGPLTEFQVAGADRKFHDARASILGDQIVVYCPKVNAPVAVRFAFHDAPKPNLFSAEGLPVVPFRTDDWDLDLEKWRKK